MHLLHVVISTLLCLGLALGQTQGPPGFSGQIAPLLSARCAGCHHPGKLKGKLDVTNYEALRKGGRHGPAVIPNDAAGSPLLTKVMGDDPEMPPEGDPLTDSDIDLLRRWIEAGAPDDTPDQPVVPAAIAPTSYPAAPSNAALAYSPDGSLLAVAGYCEVLLHDADGHGMLARLPGDAPHIASLCFSQDGRWLCVAGGAPGRYGSIQVWDVARRSLHRTHRLTTDTVFGVSISPDKRSVAVGCADKTVRMLDADTGEEQLLFRNHSDWVLGTFFSKDGKQLVSGGRDKAMKIIDLEHRRFVDDINNPLEKVLDMSRHPTMDAVVYGGDQGTTFVYRVSDNQKRTAARNDTNLVRKLERQSGSVHAVAYSRDGALIAAGGIDAAARVHDAKTGAVKARLTGHRGAIFDLDFRPTQPEVATCGQDGVIRIYDAAGGRQLRAFVPVPLENEASPTTGPLVTSLEVAPAKMVFTDPRDRRGLLVWAHTPSGAVDVTDEIQTSVEPAGIVAVDSGRVVPRSEGQATLTVEARGLVARVPVSVLAADPPPVHFGRDVMPIMSSTGCSNGTCHGAQDGQNGFLLSLRGFDPLSDHRALVQELGGRRVNRIEPASSLMLLKPTGAIPHEGGTVLEPGTRRYDTLLQWVRQGATAQLGPSSTVQRLEVIPASVNMALPAQSQRVLVIAHYEDGTTRDVTEDAIISTSDVEIATADGNRITGARRGESAVLVRYEGMYASSPVSVMGDRTGYAWRPGPQHNVIDELVQDKLRKIKSLPSALCTDAEFVRRVYLDLTGRPPRTALARTFVEDQTPSREKRERLIDALIGDPQFVEHWANKWADLLQCQSRTLGDKGVWVFRRWLSRSVAENKPYDQFVRELLTTGGSTYQKAAANYLRAVTDKGQVPDPLKLTEDITQTFLGVRFNCNKCHNHPFERWTQAQYYEFSAHFARVRFKGGPRAGEMIVFDNYDGGEAIHPRTSRQVAPRVPVAEDLVPEAEGDRLTALAQWLTSPENPLFARSYVNRVWSYFLGRGIIEPVDDIRAGNPPVNPDLLDHLERRFIESGFDFNDLVRTICRSATYQMSFRSNRWNEDDSTNFSHCIPRRLSAEQLMEAVSVATGVAPRIAGLPEGARPVEAPDGLVKNDDFLKLFGRPKRDSACECARTNDLSLAHALNLVNGESIHGATVNPKGLVSTLISTHAEDAAVVTELYWAALCRAPTKEELSTFSAFGDGPQRLTAAQDLMWALINSPAFLFNR